MKTEKQLLSMSQVARRIDRPDSAVSKAIRAGVIEPDVIVSGRVRLFRAERIEAIREALRKPEVIA